MKWITAADLERWADTHDARVRLSELVSDLIRRSAAKISGFRFPTGDSAQLPGYDGRLTADEVPPYVPGGESVFEFGVGADYLSKINHDYDERTANPRGVDPAHSTIVFVTPRRWSRSEPSIDSWCKGKIASGPWKDVRVIDGVTLEHWLELNPAVAARAARRLLGRAPEEGALSTMESWNEYASLFGPELTEEVLLCGREKQAQEFLLQLESRCGVYLWQSDSQDESVAFLVAAVRKAPEELQKFFDSRMMVLDSHAAARFLADRSNMIFVLRGEAEKLAGLLARNNIVLMGIGREARHSNATLLQRPLSHALGEALRTIGLDENKARQLARTCGRSVTILARRMPSAKAPQPVWAGQGILIPALLAGSWDASVPHDQEIVRKLAGTNTYEEYEDKLRAFLTGLDPPLELEGQVWNLRAPVDAFVWLAYLIGKLELQRMQEVFKCVFSEHDPSLDLPPEKQLFAGFSGKKLPHSHWLREGLSTTLLLISAFHEESRLTALPDPQHFVENLIASLPGLKENERLIASLQHELPVLMEAAPRPLLDALERLLEGDGSLIRPIFSDTDPVFSHSAHTGLLWALEVAAWDPQQLTEATTILAKLARVDPGGKLANRPIQSLREIFLAWHPNTNASLELRLNALDQIIAKEPGIGWELLLTLLPESYGTAQPTVKPRYKEAGASEQEVLTRGLVWQTYREVIARALRLAGADVNRWIALIPSIAYFDPDSREAARGLMDSLATSMGESDRVKLWSVLRELLNRHRAFQDAGWAMSQDEVGKLETVAQRFEPTDPMTKVAWLFNDHHPHLPAPEARADIGAVDKAREAAASDIYQAGGPRAILALATQVNHPRYVALAAAPTVADPSEFEVMLEEALGSGGALDEFAVVLSERALNKFGGIWEKRVAARVASKKLAPQQTATLLLAWPDEPETWKFAASLGGEVDSAYWTRKPVWALRKDKGVVESAVNKYLEVGRALAAIDAMNWSIELVSSALILQVLDKAVDELNTSESALSNAVLFDLERIFDELATRSDTPQLEIAKREYAYLPLLEMHLLEKSNKNLILHGIMAKDPGLFVQVLCDVFRPASAERTEPTEEERRRANVGYRLLSSFRRVPGEKDGDIKYEELKDWVKAVRSLAKESDRAKIGDEFIGHVLAHAPSDPDGFWPHRAVRELFEDLQSSEVELGAEVERHNMRGVWKKAMYEGGAQERALAGQASAAAKATQKWPRTADLWRQIAEHWRESAKREDERARHDEMKYE